MNKPQESMADFKARIALLMRNKEGGKIYSVIGAARPDPALVRAAVIEGSTPEEVEMLKLKGML